MKYYGLSDQGKIRKNNQDAFAILECNIRNCIILALCDGMGGAKAGEVASEISKRAFSEYVLAKLSSRTVKYPVIEEILYNACEEANGVSYEYSLFDEQFFGMGTTLVGGVVYSNGDVKLINVGDSRAYLIKPKKNRIEQITRDHSFVQELVNAGLITPEEAAVHPDRHVITRALGTEMIANPDFFELSMKQGEVLLLCSDGLSNYVSDEQILSAVCSCREPEAICRTLLKNCYDSGAPDNVTIISVVKR